MADLDSPIWTNLTDLVQIHDDNLKDAVNQVVPVPLYCSEDTPISESAKDIYTAIENYLEKVAKGGRRAVIISLTKRNEDKQHDLPILDLGLGIPESPSSWVQFGETNKYIFSFIRNLQTFNQYL